MEIVIIGSVISFIGALLFIILSMVLYQIRELKTEIRVLSTIGERLTAHEIRIENIEKRLLTIK